ncbi:SURF1 family protein [Rhodopila sp.]|uniref:SURF1 family protein n=1 Tax=Rhodopila sp. TaxID=2480087 RepID=UPI003D12B093
MTSARSRFLIPTLTTLIMLAILVGLGTWQIYRLHWKQGILKQIAASEAAPPAPLTPDPASYAKVSATGRFRFDLAVQFGADVRDTNTGPTMGTYQIVPLQRDGAPTVLVDRGWVPQQSATAVDDPTGVVSVTGYVRPGDTQHWFSPTDDTASRQFYTLDPAAIGAAVGVRNVLPFTLVALGPANGASYPAPAQHLPRPPNNHLSYVITWYGLAVALVVIFGAWVRKAQRS